MIRTLLRTLRFAHDANGTATKQWAIVMAGIGLAAVVAANVASTAARHGGLPQIVWSTPHAPLPGSIDYTATASIAASTRLDPCTGKAK